MSIADLKQIDWKHFDFKAIPRYILVGSGLLLLGILMLLLGILL